MATMQQLVEQYVPLANKLAYQKKRVLPLHVDVEDLKSAAYLGLVEAASRFDESHGVAFSTYAYPRIFGAIHDFLREQGWLKRNDSRQMHSLDSQMDEGDGTLGDTIADNEERNEEEFLEVVSNGLDAQAGTILRLYFVEEYSMKEVGDRIGVSESRVSQLLKRYKQQIQDNWTPQGLYEELAA